MSAFRYEYNNEGDGEEEDGRLWNCSNSTEFLYHCQYLLNGNEAETFNDLADIETTPTSLLLKLVRSFHENAVRPDANPKTYTGYKY